jgi:hypothetical protein
MSGELNEHISSTITQDNVGLARADFGVSLILSCNTPGDFTERTRTYIDMPGIAADFATDSPEYLMGNKVFSQRPRPDKLKIGRAVGQPTQRYQINITDVALGNTYSLQVEGEGVTSTAVEYMTLADLTFTASDAGDVMTSVAHGMITGDGPYRVSNSGGALPTGLAVDTNYWIIELTTDTFQLASTKAFALAETEIVISSDGTGTQTLRRNQNDVICAQLVQSLNDVEGANYTAAQTVGAGETDYITITGDAAGNWFSIAIVASITRMKIAQTHAEPATALATDLNAISEEDDDWYFLLTAYNSDAYVKAAAAWIESVTKIYIADNSESDAPLTVASVSDGDLANDLHNLGYARTACIYHPSPYNFAAAAWVGRVAPTTPGKATWKFKRLRGVTPVSGLTATHRDNLRDKACNCYTNLTSTLPQTWEGMTVDGNFIDATRGDDWVDDDMKLGIAEVLAGNDIVPMSPAGINMIEAPIRATLERAVENGIYLGEGVDENDVPLAPTITVPKIGDISAANRAARILPDMKWHANRSNATHHVEVAGTVSL